MKAESNATDFLRKSAVATVAAVLFLLPLRAEQPAPKGNASAIARQADEALRSSNYDRAIREYDLLLEISPKSAAAWSNLGSAWFAKGVYANASHAYIQASQLEPGDADYAFNAALALIREDKCIDAKSYLRTSLRSGVYIPRARYLGGMCAFVAQQWLDAKQQLEGAVSAGSNSAETYYMLTIAARKSDDPSTARRAYLLLEKEYGNSSFYHELTGEALDRADQDSAAQKQIELAIAGSPHTPGLHAQLGLLLWKFQHFDEAESAFKEELAIDPNSYSAHYYLGDIAEKNNRPDDALAHYAQALQSRPDSAEAHFALGRAMEAKGQSSEALKQFEDATPQMQNDSSLHYWKARSLRHLGSTEQANTEMAKVRAINAAERSDLLRKLGNGAQ